MKQRVPRPYLPPFEIIVALLALAIIVIAFSSCASWRSSDRVLGVTAVAAIGADCGTTIYLSGTDPTWVERNPILGARPSPAKVLGLCALAAGATLAVADALPANAWRTTWLGTVSVVEVLLVLHNLGVLTFNPWTVLR